MAAGREGHEIGGSLLRMAQRAQALKQHMNLYDILLLTSTYLPTWKWKSFFSKLQECKVYLQKSKHGHLQGVMQLSADVEIYLYCSLDLPRWVSCPVPDSCPDNLCVYPRLKGWVSVLWNRRRGVRMLSRHKQKDGRTSCEAKLISLYRTRWAHKGTSATIFMHCCQSGTLWCGNCGSRLSVCEKELTG